MNFIKNVFTVVFSAWFIYYFKLYSVTKSRALYHLFQLPESKTNIEFNIIARTLFETILYLAVILMFYLAFKMASHFFPLDKMFLVTVVVSPILFEISMVLYDKSCYKPWYHWDTVVWYFPMRLVLWAILYWVFKDLMPMLKEKRSLLIIGCVFLIFHLFKIHSRYNF